MTANSPAARCSVGIDVSKDALDIFIDSSTEEYCAANRADDIAALVERLRVVAPDYVVVEASGGFESEVVTALATEGLPVCRVSPRRVRSFTRALGELAKTDRLDARLLARYGRDCRPQVSRLSDAETAELEALMQRRRQLIEMYVAESNRLETAPRVVVKQLRGTCGGWRSASMTRTRSCGGGSPGCRCGASRMSWCARCRASGR